VTAFPVQQVARTWIFDGVQFRAAVREFAELLTGANNGAVWLA
jgi:hypothetical protein